jgi:hypothetical protein
MHKLTIISSELAESVQSITNIHNDASSHPQIEKLKGAINYGTWVMHIKMYFIHNEWDQVRKLVPKVHHSTKESGSEGYS